MDAAADAAKESLLTLCYVSPEIVSPVGLLSGMAGQVPEFPLAERLGNTASAFFTSPAGRSSVSLQEQHRELSENKERLLFIMDKLDYCTVPGEVARAGSRQMIEKSKGRI